MNNDSKYDLFLGDCICGMAMLPEKSIDLVVTSPPYNLGTNYDGGYDDGQDREIYLDWCAQWTAQVRRVLQPNGSFFLNIGSAPANPLLPFQIVLELTRGGFVLQNVIHHQINRHRRPLTWAFQTDQFEAVPERLSRIRFPFHENRTRRSRTARAGCALPGQEQHRPLDTHRRQRSPLQGQHLVYSL
jgi:DNA modification methylase